MPIVLRIEDLWKRFRIPHERRSTIVDHLAGALSLLEGKRYNYEEFWALKQINFKLERGESLGIIGPNGSGKSSLLKLVAGVMRPDRGSIVINGSMAIVLQLGVGFHGDLTVKENTRVYGVIMGLPRSEMKKCTGSILDFAGLTRFQDARLRNLSSGMQVRLAFSIAIQTEADIFLIDEALAVGDMDFQQKCLDKFREFKKEEKSIVLVSHSMDLIKSYCEKTLYLLNGEPRALGPSEEVTNQYLSDIGA
ncbi:MAG: ABC transporter ATP-binding protein [Candidatus Bathyarchaeia archaeon]|jgi:lipopolysaccharide transport system ATP-binding protein